MCVGDEAIGRERRRARGRGVGSQECSIIQGKGINVPGTAAARRTQRPSV